MRRRRWTIPPSGALGAPDPTGHLLARLDDLALVDPTLLLAGDERAELKAALLDDLAHAVEEADAMVDRLLQAQDLSDREGAGKKLQLAGQIRRRSARVAAVLARLRGDG